MFLSEKDLKELELVCGQSQPDQINYVTALKNIIPAIKEHGEINWTISAKNKINRPMVRFQIQSQRGMTRSNSNCSDQVSVGSKQDSMRPSTNSEYFATGGFARMKDIEKKYGKNHLGYVQKNMGFSYS